MEHVARGELGLPVLVELPICSIEVTVAPDDLFGLWIPHNQLLVAVLAGIKLVNVEFLSCPTAGLPECQFAQTANFLHDSWRVVSRNDIDFVMTFICHSKLPVGGQFLLQQFFADWLDNFLLHVFFYRLFFG